MSEQEQTPQAVLEQWLAFDEPGLVAAKLRVAIRAVLAEVRRAEKLWGAAQERAEKMEAERDALRVQLNEERACHDCAEYRGLLAGKLAQAEAEVSRSHAAILVLTGEVERLRAAAWLVGEDEGCFLRGGSLALLCSDTFGYAVADCEKIDMADAPKVKAIVESEGWPGVVRWIAERRGSKPIKEVTERIKLIDKMRLRAERAEAALRWCDEFAPGIVEQARAALRDTAPGGEVKP